MKEPSEKITYIESQTLAKALRMCVSAAKSNLLQLNLLDGNFSLKVTNEGIQLSPESEKKVLSYFFPYKSSEVIGSFDYNVDNLYELRILAYVGFMAMGGVERNTIAVLSKIESPSAILAFQRPAPHQGDLTLESFKSGIPVITMNFSGEKTSRLHLAAELFNPNWLWICNWSVEDSLESSFFHQLPRSYKIADQRSYDHEHGWINSISLDYIEGVDAVIATNGPIKERLLKITRGKFTEKIQTIRSSLRFDDEPIQKKQKETGGCDFYQISRIVPQKRIDRGIGLSDLLNRSGFNDTWNIVGDGELRSNLEISSWKNKAVRFLGFQDSKIALKSACALIQTSDFEGLPLVIIEALSLGIPVFSTTTGDLQWLQTQLPRECRPMLELADAQPGMSFQDNFMLWRRNYESTCNQQVRDITSMKVRELFDASRAANDYSQIFMK